MKTASSSSRFTVGPDRSGRLIDEAPADQALAIVDYPAAALHFAASECNCRLADIHRAAAGIVLEFMPFARGAAHIH